MRFGVIRDLVARTRNEPKRAAVAQFRLELTAEAEQDVPLLAPVVRTITRRIFHHANTHSAERARARPRNARFSLVLGYFHGIPVRGAEGNVLQVHGRVWWEVRVLLCDHVEARSATSCSDLRTSYRSSTVPFLQALASAR